MKKRLSNTELSNRGLQWVEFSNKVLNHIETYTVPQYGDKPYDSVYEWNSKECFVNINKYIKRFGNNSRDNQEFLDMIKIAHYACLTHDKMKNENMKKQLKHEHYEGRMKSLLESLIISEFYNKNEKVQITVTEL